MFVCFAIALYYCIKSNIMKLVKCISSSFCSELKVGNYYFVEDDCFREVFYIRGPFGLIGFGKQNFVSI